MPTQDDMLGAGFPPLQAQILGNAPTTLVTTGTTQATAASIRSHLITLTTAASQTGAILPSDAKIGTPYYVSNPTATAGIVYAPVSPATLNGAASTTGLSIAQNKAAIFIQMARNVWVSLLTA